MLKIEDKREAMNYFLLPKDELIENIYIVIPYLFPDFISFFGNSYRYDRWNTQKQRCLVKVEFKQIPPISFELSPAAVALRSALTRKVQANFGI
jgi:hypothetical protein